jgi:deoxyinosine 3'endonuclease (endonuclease V)
MEQKEIIFTQFRRKILNTPPQFPKGSAAEKRWLESVKSNRDKGLDSLGRFIERNSILYRFDKGWPTWYSIRCVFDAGPNISYYGLINGYHWIAGKNKSCLVAQSHFFEIERVYYSYSSNEKNTTELVGISRPDMDIDRLLAENPEVLQRMKEMMDEDLWDDRTIGFIYDRDPEMISLAKRVIWAMNRKQKMDEGYVDPATDFVPHYILQNELLEKVIKTDHLPLDIHYVAGVDVAFHDLDLRMVAAIVVLDARTLELVDEVVVERDLTMPFIPRLFSYMEAPFVMEAWEKLKVKPDLVICDGHGADHPKNIGLATHLGVSLDVPCIGCARLRFMGEYDPTKLGIEKGSTQPLLYEDTVGVALRTQDNAAPLYISTGHRVSVETAVDWVLRLCRHKRLPETTRQADRLVHTILPERTEFDFWAGAGPMSAVEPPPDWPDINKVLINRGVNED